MCDAKNGANCSDRPIKWRSIRMGVENDQKRKIWEWYIAMKLGKRFIVLCWHGMEWKSWYNGVSSLRSASTASLPFLVASTDRNDAETVLTTSCTETSNNLAGLSLLATQCVCCIVQGNYLQSDVTWYLLSSRKTLTFVILPTRKLRRFHSLNFNILEYDVQHYL